MNNSYVTQPGKSTLALRSLAGQIFWRMPLRFEIAKLFGPAYSLRCLVFHDISRGSSKFTTGLGVTITPEEFEGIIEFACLHYTPVGLEDYLNGRDNRSAPKRPILITFDDAYASVALNAAPILQKYHVPAIFFVNSGFVGNQKLAVDNLLCYVANVCGVERLCSVARPFAKNTDVRLTSLADVLDNLLPTMTQTQVQQLREALFLVAEKLPSELAAEANLYLNEEQLRKLSASGFEIGSHTSSHVFCRMLTEAEFCPEIDDNKKALEAITGTRLTAFSVPYGGPADLTPELVEDLRRSGHKVAFLARDRANFPRTDAYRLNRINIHAGNNASLFGEIEILPRLRSLADALLGRNGRLPTA